MKSLYRYITSRQLVIGGMLVPILLLTVVGFLQWRSVNAYRISREGVTHTRIVLLDLESLLSCMNDAETGQRGYLLTRKESYLEPYENATNRNQAQIQTLQQLTSDNLEQQKKLDRLEPLIKAKLQELAQTVALERSMDHAGAMKIVMSDFGKNTMDQIRAILGDMLDTEQDLLQKREEAYQQSSRVNAKLSGLLISLGLMFIIAVFWLMRRLSQMQEMIKICAWSRLIEYEGEWLTIEDYLSRRFKFQVTHGMSDVEAKKMLKLLEKEKAQQAA